MAYGFGKVPERRGVVAAGDTTELTRSLVKSRGFYLFEQLTSLGKQIRELDERIAEWRERHDSYRAELCLLKRIATEGGYAEDLPYADCDEELGAESAPEERGEPVESGETGYRGERVERVFRRAPKRA